MPSLGGREGCPFLVVPAGHLGLQALRGMLPTTPLPQTQSPSDPSLQMGKLGRVEGSPIRQPRAGQRGLPGLQSPCLLGDPRVEDRQGEGAHLDITGHSRAAHATSAAARRGCWSRAGGPAWDPAWCSGAGLAIPVLQGPRGIAWSVQEVIKAVAAPEWVGPESRKKKEGKRSGVRYCCTDPIFWLLSVLQPPPLHMGKRRLGLKAILRGGRRMDTMTFTCSPPLRAEQAGLLGKGTDVGLGVQPGTWLGVLRTATHRCHAWWVGPCPLQSPPLLTSDHPGTWKVAHSWGPWSSWRPLGSRSSRNSWAPPPKASHRPRGTSRSCGVETEVP